MSEPASKHREHIGGKHKAVEHFATLPGQASTIDIATDDAHRQRMAEYCQSVAVPHELRETVQPLMHRGEFYLPGVF